MSKDIQLSELELQKIAILQQKRAQAEAAARAQIGAIEAQMNDTFDLIGDRYGVDLKDGGYKLDQGRLVEVGAEEKAEPKKQLLKED